MLFCFFLNSLFFGNFFLLLRIFPQVYQLYRSVETWSDQKTPGSAFICNRCAGKHVSDLQLYFPGHERINLCKQIRGSYHPLPMGCVLCAAHHSHIKELLNLNKRSSCAPRAAILLLLSNDNKQKPLMAAIEDQPRPVRRYGLTRQSQLI